MSSEYNRRDFMKWLTFSAASCAAARMSLAADAKVIKRTYTFKTVGQLEIKADVHRADDDAVRPVAMWIHGGALIMGNREGISRRVLETLLGAGFAVVSIDYRLAPETKLPAILQDVEDAYAWVREKGPSLFGVDTKKIAVLGGSAGGYLTLCTGYRVTPRPAVLVAFWGYGDIAGDWYARPSNYYRGQALVPKEEAYAGVRGPELTDGSIKGDLRRKFYLYCRQCGLWPQEVAGLDPVSQNKAFDPLCPLRNVTKDYPPTLLIHGDQDTDVPYEQSVIMAREFERAGVPHRFVGVPGAGHGLSGGDPRLVDAAYDAVLPFIQRSLNAT